MSDQIGVKFPTYELFGIIFTWHSVKQKVRLKMPTYCDKCVIMLWRTQWIREHKSSKILDYNDESRWISCCVKYPGLPRTLLRFPPCSLNVFFISCVLKRSFPNPYFPYLADHDLRDFEHCLGPFVTLAHVQSQSKSLHFIVVLTSPKMHCRLHTIRTNSSDQIELKNIQKLSQISKKPKSEPC